MYIKICGITRPEEAGWLNQCRVDFAGFVLFYPKSRRNVSLEEAERIMAELSPEIRRVAVTVSPDPEQARRIEAAGFDCIQIHGEIPEEILNNIHIPIWKAFNGTDMEHFERYRQSKAVTGYVLDAPEPGSGRCFDWNRLGSIPREDRLVMLAGGLHPGNVAAAIRAVDPDGVDVSSGVEAEDGQGKDLHKIRAFVQAVRTATA